MFNRIKNIVKWGTIHTRDGIERVLSPSKFREINDRVYVPSWIESEYKSVYIGIDSEHQGEYFSIGRIFQRPQLYPVFEDSNSKQSVSISPQQKFVGVDMSIIDIQNTDSLEISATFKHPNGEKTEKTIQYNLQDFYLHEGRILPISLTLSDPAIEATINLNSNNQTGKLGSSFPIPERFRQYNWKKDKLPRLSIPSPRGTQGTPILLISVDTFRNDALEAFEPVLEALGEDAVIPKEPRTQGHWTRPAHASLFTGVHPRTHGYVGAGGENQGQYGLPSNLTTIPEILTNNLYKCSGCVPRAKTGVEYGFGRGMHRYKYNPISWADPDYDGADSVDQLIQWIDRDRHDQSDRLFYFLHLFDSHYPYMPTVFSDVSPVDFDLLEDFNSVNGTDDYLETLANPTEMADDDIESIKSYYYRSVEYVAEQIARLIHHLKSVGLYRDSLLIITGDHGEDFFEREFAGHSSVTDANIRPGMIVKPPADSNIKIPNNADIIDILPTIAELIGEDVPNQCEGIAWYDKSDTPRVTERIRPDYYTISVELESTKAIYTYQENFPNCPTESQIEDGPVDVRFYDTTSRATDGALNQIDPHNSLKEKFNSVVKTHVKGQKIEIAQDEQVPISEETIERLQHLGYK